MPRRSMIEPKIAGCNEKKVNKHEYKHSFTIEIQRNEKMSTKVQKNIVM